MVDPASIASALGIAGDAIEGASNWVEYTRKYKGERVEVRTHSIERVGGKHDAEVHFYAYVIEGTIEEVVSFPPGFHLSDVTESMERARRNMSKQEHPVETMGDAWDYSPDRQGIRETNRKFISFRDIDQLEFPELEDVTEKM